MALLQCTQCKHKTTTTKKLQKHVRKTHERKIYSCPDCDYKSRKIGLYRAHRSTCLPIIPGLPLQNKEDTGNKEALGQTHTSKARENNTWTNNLQLPIPHGTKTDLDKHMSIVHNIKVLGQHMRKVHSLYPMTKTVTNISFTKDKLIITKYYVPKWTVE